ncbi:hypothetical protein E0W68_09665 [Flavobacterium salilacus subsp. salilacus]|uniref:hypothetical protein n=1 Tax=Flavobacterium TaxID=237 RepID=UPI0010756D82|nr:MULTISPECIES: hypothetical protein [Flavobacterium]KAF2518280.1 hypothetical protein E0W68_09665 [Flavobacterium salilacus subsp. salilacus]MBE1615308.1 hypothetical protein [Flavobacterium sp. SaA2.13]
MELKYQYEISLIDDCPVNNESGNKMLFRCVEENMTEKSFTPNAVLLKPKLQDNCLAWGLSLFSTYESAKQMLKSLSKNKRVNYSRIAVVNVTDDDGIKHCSKNELHYTFYPKKDLDIINKFTYVNDGE